MSKTVVNGIRFFCILSQKKDKMIEMWYICLLYTSVITVKINAFVEDLRTKSVAELKEELVAAKKELFNLRFQNATNQLDNTGRIKEVRKNIARIQTVITEMCIRDRDMRLVRQKQ